MEELVTVIVPVYNKRSQLERCVASVAGQSHTCLQILLIDDGSTDGSGELCDRLAEGDERIEVIHQANGGVSAARNTGLGRMRGAWMAFVDADDFVSPHYLEDMLAAREGCDMVICRCTWVPEDAREIDVPFHRLSRTEHITGREASVRHFKNHALYGTCWGRLVRARLWDGLRFPEGKIAEDLFASHALLYRAASIAVTDAVLYAYVQSEGSIMRSEFSARRLDALDAWEEGVRVFTAAGEPGIADIARRVYCGRVMDARCICRARIPQDKETLRQLRLRAAQAYRGVRHIYRYIDCSRGKALAHRLVFFVGRWCLPLYAVLVARRGWHSYI